MTTPAKPLTSLAVPPMTPGGMRAGEYIGEGLRVVRPLGEGAMGVVVLAYDERLQREVAIKLIRPTLLSSEQLRASFVDEARAMARVNHPNVVQIYTLGEHEGAPFFVMEYVPGASLDAWLAGQKKLPVGRDDAMRLLEQLCAGVAAVHDAKTVHGDLKPANVRLGPNARVAVTDLGLARLFARPGSAERLPIAGSPAYMAPEIAAQEPVAPALVPRVDIYSLGCLAHELLTGVLPTAAPGPERYLEAIGGTTDLTLPSELRPDLPAAFDAALVRALDPDPARRTPDARTFFEALSAAHASTPVEGARPVRILVAEDDDDFRAVLAIAFQREFKGAEIEAVADGRAALEAYERKPASVAVIDLRMPELNGIELTARLRAIDPERAMPIIVLTASGGAAEWQRLSALGADGFLVKPVNLVDVVTLVRRSLDERSHSLPPNARSSVF